MRLSDFDRKYAEKQHAKIMQSIRVEGQCWVWLKSCGGGYPQKGGMYLGRAWGGKVHLLLWEANVGAIPDHQILMKTCSTAKCVSPEHYRLGFPHEQTEAAIAAQPRPTRETDRARFMKYVGNPKKSKSDCWIWDGGKIGAAGYGTFWLDGKQMFAHRASYILFKGPIPEGQVIMHACDDRACVLPQHLTAGTLADNSADMKRKGRSARGSKNGQALLTEAKVRKIRADYTGGYGDLTRLANKHGLKLSTVAAIVHRQNWRHIG